MHARTERDRAGLAILEEASIVFSTLSFAGAPLFQRTTRRFDVVIVDEAAQAVEPSVLIPLSLGCKQARAREELLLVVAVAGRGAQIRPAGVGEGGGKEGWERGGREPLPLTASSP